MSTQQEQIINTIKEIAEDKKLSEDFVIKAFEQAIVSEYTHEFVDSQIDVVFENNSFKLYRVYVVVDNVDNDDFDDYIEIGINDAKKLDPSAAVGSTIRKPIEFSSLSKKLIQNIWGNFRHNLNSEVNKSIYSGWKNKKDTIGYYEVHQIDGNKYIIKISNEIFGILLPSEQIRGENLISGKKYHFVIVDVLENSRDWPIILSRTSDLLFMYLLYKNVPEINEGLIEVKKLARIPGERSKLLVKSGSGAENINPVGTIIGPGGSRINAIKNELSGERIDVILWSDDIKTLIMNLCAPIQLIGARITDKMISLVVDDTNHSTKWGGVTNNAVYLLGNSGNNIKLISKILERTVEVITPSDAEEIEVAYEPFDYTNSNIGNKNGTYRGNNESNGSKTQQKKRVVDLGIGSFDDFANEGE
ncbi:MAG: hypothetical protein LBB95_00030 [Mycoplasmataceae bacterium]|nr:hypothetical protein [Mycoplasmataceae bacterium]